MVCGKTERTCIIGLASENSTPHMSCCSGEKMTPRQECRKIFLVPVCTHSSSDTVTCMGRTSKSTSGRYPETKKKRKHCFSRGDPVVLGRKGPRIYVIVIIFLYRSARSRTLKRRHAGPRGHRTHLRQEQEEAEWAPCF